MSIKKTVTLSFALSLLLTNSLLANNITKNNNVIKDKKVINSTQQDEKELFKLKVNMINKYGSTITTPLFFKNYSFLKINVAKAFYNTKKKTSELLLKVTNTETFPFNIKKILNIGETDVKTLKPGQTAYIVLDEKSFEQYITDISNKNFKNDKARLDSLKVALDTMMKDLEKVSDENDKLSLSLKNLEINNNQLLTKMNSISKMILKVIGKFPTDSIKLAIKQVSSDDNISLENLDLVSQFAVLRILINEKSETLSNYMTSLDVSNLQNTIELLQKRNDTLDSELSKLHPYIVSISKIFNLDFSDDISDEKMLENIVTSSLNLKESLDKNDATISELSKTIQKLKKENSLLKTDNRKYRKLIKNFDEASSISKISKCELSNRKNENRYKDILKENNLLKLKNTELMDENKELFEKYDKSSTEIEKLYNDKTLLKMKIKKLQGLL
jgi:hypothetical protein